MILRACGGAAAVAALLMGAASAHAQPAELPATVVTLTGKAELFRKGDLLYGLDRARTAIAKQERAVVVEGNTEVMRALRWRCSAPPAPARVR